MNKPVVIFGGGEQGRIAFDALYALDCDIAGVVDRIQPPNFKARWLGDFRDSLAEYKDLRWHVAVGDNGVRDRLIEDVASEITLSLMTVVHPTAVIGSEVNLGPGIFVAAQAVVAHSAKLGPGCLINHGATVDHDCVLERSCHVAPGAHLAGRVRVGERTLVGVGASVIPGIQIGSDAVVGAGSVVIRDIPSGSKVAGNPARPI